MLLYFRDWVGTGILNTVSWYTEIIILIPLITLLHSKFKITANMLFVVVIINVVVVIVNVTVVVIINFLNP